MSALIDELKRQHVEIEKMLEKLKDPRVSNREAHSILLSAQRSLLAHLRKEDAELYPALRRAAAQDSRLKRTVEFYARDMEEITADAGAFFTRYSGDAEIDREFAKRFGALFATISRRLRSEERTIYDEYERLQAQG